jgi:hypothetical protein
MVVELSAAGLLGEGRPRRQLAERKKAPFDAKV